MLINMSLKAIVGPLEGFVDSIINEVQSEPEYIKGEAFGNVSVPHSTEQSCGRS